MSIVRAYTLSMAFTSKTRRKKPKGQPEPHLKQVAMAHHKLPPQANSQWCGDTEIRVQRSTCFTMKKASWKYLRLASSKPTLHTRLCWRMCTSNCTRTIRAWLKLYRLKLNPRLLSWKKQYKRGGSEELSIIKQPLLMYLYNHNQ